MALINETHKQESKEQVYKWLKYVRFDLTSLDMRRGFALACSSGRIAHSAAGLAWRRGRLGLANRRSRKWGQFVGFPAAMALASLAHKARAHGNSAWNELDHA
jgi:hypothetical protein